MNNQNQKQEVLQRELVFFDCEMSGSDTRYNHIIEIGAVRIDSETGELLDTFVRLVKFPWGSPYEREALRITGFNWKQWKKYASPLQTVLREFKDFSANAGLAAWGCENDITFLSAACAKTGVDSICPTSSIFKPWLRAGGCAQSYLQLQTICCSQVPNFTEQLWTRR